MVIKAAHQRTHQTKRSMRSTLQDGGNPSIRRCNGISNRVHEFGLVERYSGFVLRGLSGLVELMGFEPTTF
jgi:hypothetical protein